MTSLSRPEVPKPACRVKLIAGPPAAGKSTYVKKFAKPGDVVIDFDDIGREFGITRDRSWTDAVRILRERNRRLINLTLEPPEATAWVIFVAPSIKLRAWWCQMLGVRPEDCVVLVPSRQILRERVRRDPSRRHVILKNLELIDKWFARERANDPGPLVSGFDEEGNPTDPLHHWND